MGRAVAPVSAVCMAHRSRSHFVDELLPKLGRDIEVVWDEREDRWDTGRRALMGFDPVASHRLVLQDDAVPCRDFLAGAEKALEVAGERPVAFYIGKVRPHRRTITPAVRMARARGSAWLATRGPLWGVAIAIPTAHIREVVGWGDRHPNIANYDGKIARWYRRSRIDCWYTLPSLVDHRPVAENPSLIEGRTGNRQAHWFIGEERSALDIDWNGTVLIPSFTRPPE